MITISLPAIGEITLPDDATFVSNAKDGRMYIICAKCKKAYKFGKCDSDNINKSAIAAAASAARQGWDYETLTCPDCVNGKEQLPTLF
ncbi:MAG: hypothetical protein LIP09_04820 [Bacteroidales bacterium]|nr:hypothetical protein [Bacteroidales bacterium]